MYWKLFCKIKKIENQFGKFVKIIGPDHISKEDYWIYIKHQDYIAHEKGEKFLDVFKEYSQETLEFMLNGNAPSYICPNTKKRKISHKAYVTNASANSIVFYAGIYLNNLGLNLSTINKLRKKYNTGNLDKKRFSLDELRESFIKQSAFFLNLYKKMNEHDRFEHFVDELDDKKFEQIFERYEDNNAVKRSYNRRIFHDNFECSSMRNNYEEDVFYVNTGVFVEKKIIKDPDYYVIEQNFLEALQMRVCKNCRKGLAPIMIDYN